MIKKKKEYIDRREMNDWDGEVVRVVKKRSS